MSLDENDLEQIEKIVGGIESRLSKKIDGVEVRFNNKIDSVETRLSKNIEQSEKRVISIIGREITDLAEINHQVLQELDSFKGLEKRVVRLEQKVGISS